MYKGEHLLQSSCVKWFNYQYPIYKGVLFAIPNGGSRNKIEAKKLKAEGVVAGVSDLFLAVPNKNYHGLFIEMKYERNTQTEKQKTFQENVEKQGYKYEIIREFNQFTRVINEYLCDN